MSNPGEEWRKKLVALGSHLPPEAAPYICFGLQIRAPIVRDPRGRLYHGRPANEDSK